MRIQCPKCKATSGEIQYNQIVSRTVTFHLDSSSEDGIGDVTTEVFESGTPTEVQCNECGYEGTAEEFGFKTETLEEALRALDLHDINKALDKGWKPNMKDVWDHYATHMSELPGPDLVEMYTSKVFGDDPSIAKQVNGLSSYLEIAAGEFLVE